MKKEIRYHFNGHFVEEQRLGFPVHHQIQKDVETFAELQDIYDGFLSGYNKLYCKGLAIGISEESTLVE